MSDANPYRSPDETPQSPNSDDAPQKPVNYIWPLIGFTFGSVVIAALCLCDARTSALVGMTVGGIPFGFLGLWYAFRRAGRHGA